MTDEEKNALLSVEPNVQFEEHEGGNKRPISYTWEIEKYLLKWEFAYRNEIESREFMAQIGYTETVTEK